MPRADCRQLRLATSPLGPHCLCDASNARLPLGGSSDQVQSLCSLLDWLVLVWTLHLLESGLKALG